MAADPVRRRMDATLTRYHLVGMEPHEHPLAVATVDPERAEVWDANQVRSVRASEPDDIDEVLAWIDEQYRATSHRKITMDADTPTAFEARLSLDGWQVDTLLQHLLLGPVLDDRPAPEGVTIRPVADDDDWASMVRLSRLDHIEDAAKEGRPLWSEELTAQMVSHRRRKAPEVQPYLASLDGEDVGMFSAMPGIDGMGLVEDLFVHPEARGRGISVLLIRRCVDDARARGADEVIIGSMPGDWPKRLYTRLGFRPLFVERVWERDPPGSPPGSSTA